MDTTLLRQALLNASVHQLGEVIDWLERPWAPSNNDALRGAWHEARRDHGAKRALAYAIEQEVRGLASSPGERDAAHVARRVGSSVPTAEAVATEVTRRLVPPIEWPFAVKPEVIASALRATADLAQLVLGTGAHRRRRHRGYHHGRR